MCKFLFLSIGCHKSRQQTSGGSGIRHQVSASGIGESFPTSTTQECGMTIDSLV